MDKEALVPYNIEWKDAHSTDEWEDLTTCHAQTFRLIKSMGWLVSENETRVILALSWDTQEEKVSQSLCIPTGMIVSKTKLSAS